MSCGSGCGCNPSATSDCGAAGAGDFAGVPSVDASTAGSVCPSGGGSDETDAAGGDPCASLALPLTFARCCLAFYSARVASADRCSQTQIHPKDHFNAPGRTNLCHNRYTAAHSDTLIN